MRSDASSPPASPVGALLLAGAAFYAALVLQGIGRNGNALALLGAGCLALFGVTRMMIAMNAFDSVRDRRRLKRRLEKFSDKQGISRLGTLADARAHGLTTGRGTRLGRIDGALLSTVGEGGIMSFGPPGSGKSLGFMETLLTAEIGDGDGNPVSIIVFDPGAELFCTTHRRQRELGREVIAHCPEWRTLSRDLGVDIPHCNIDPCQMLDPQSESILDDAKLLAEFIHPGTPLEKAHGNSRHFDQAGRLYLMGQLLRGISTNENFNLADLHSATSGSTNAQIAAIAEMQLSNVFGGALSRLGGELETPLTQSPEEWSGILSTAARAVELFDTNSPFGKAVRNGGLNWKSVRETPTCLYCIVSPARAKTHGAYNNLIISQAFEMLARDYSARRRKLFILDEAAGLGFMPNAVKALEQYRKYGEVLWFGLQEVAQLYRLYGRETAREMLGMVDVIQASSVRQIEDLKMLSELVGNETAANGSHSIDASCDGRPPHIRYTGQYRSRPLLRPEDIRMLPPDKQLVLYRNAPAFVADKLDYRRDPSIVKHADPNPYYRTR